MKLTSLLSSLSLAAVVAFGLALIFNIGATALFAVSVALLIMQTAASDYSSGPRFVGARPVPARRRERHPLAA